MARFDVHRGKTGRTPYLLDVQSDFLDQLDTRLVIPLLREGEMRGIIDRLHPRVAVEGERLVVATNLMASVRRAQLGGVVASLASERDGIVAAIDFLLQGF